MTNKKKILLIICMLLLLVSSVNATYYELSLQTANTENLEDTYVLASNPTANSGGGTTLFIGGYDSGTPDIEHDFFIKFNISMIPVGAEIIKANITLTTDSNLIDAGEWFAIGIHHIYQNFTWDENSLNYNNRPQTSSYMNLTREDEDNLTNTHPTGAGDKLTYNITKMTSISIDMGDVNLSIGFIPYGYGGSPATFDDVDFGSKEYPFSSDRPLMKVYYFINESPTLSLDYNFTYPVTPLPSQDLKFNITCSQSVIDFSTSMTGYVQLYNGSSPYGSVQSQVVSNNTETTIYTLSSSLTSTGEVWTGEYWCGDTYTNTTKQNSSVTITDPVINFVTSNNSYTSDTTPNINFNISSNYDETFNCSLYVDSVIKGTRNNILNDTNTYITSTALTQGNKEYYVTCDYTGSNTITSLNQNITIDTTTPTITLTSPNDDYIETNDNTPDFTFKAYEDINTTMTCELLIEGIGYGINTSVLNNTLTTITANTSLTDGEYDWRISCSDQFYKGYSIYRTLNINLNNPIVNITFYDQETGLIVDTVNISLELITDYYSSNHTTEVGWINITMIEGVMNTLRYGATGYNERFYFVTPTNDSTYPLTLYMISDSDAYNVTITVIDQNADPVEDAYVKALKYDVITNSYLLQEVGRTNFLGETSMSLTYNDEYYKFIIDYDGETLRTTNPLYITSSTYTIQVIIGDVIGEEFDYYNTLSYELTFNNVTNNFRLDYNDVSGLVGSVCLYVYNTTLFDKTLVNSTCLGTASGSILLGVNPINGTSYEAKAYYTKSSTTSYLTGLIKEFTSDPEFLNYGLWLQIIVTTTFALMGLWKIEVSAIITPLSLILGRYIGLTSFNYTILIPLLVVGIIIAMIAGNRS